MEEREAASSATTLEESKGYSRGHWRPDEDDKLRRLVEKYGPKNWNFIAQRLHGRSGKSCRLRWFNQLDPRVKRTPFTSDEEQLLLAAHRAHGNKWSLIARFFPGRTDNAVKNQWHVINSRRRRRTHEHASSSSLSSSDSGGGERKQIESSDCCMPGVQPIVEVPEGCVLSHGRANAITGARGGALATVPFFDFLGVGITS